MTSTKPHVVIVMESFQMPWQYRYLKASLVEWGYEATVVNLPSTILVGSKSIPDSFWKDVDAVKRAVTEEIQGGHDVVVVAHGQGGVAASVALKGFEKKESKPGVTHIVFLAAWLVEPGITGHEKALEKGLHFDWMKSVDGLEFIRGNAKPVLYNEVPDLLADDAANFVFPRCQNVNDARIPHVAWEEIPSTYVVCEKDCCLPATLQDWIISSCQLPGEVFRLESGHSPFLHMPGRVAAIVRVAAGENEVDLKGVHVGRLP